MKKLPDYIPRTMTPAIALGLPKSKSDVIPDYWYNWANDVFIAVSSVFNVDVIELMEGKRGGRNITEGRQTVALVLRKYYRIQSYPKIARLMRLDHSTVIHSVKQIEALMDAYPEKKERTAQVITELLTQKRPDKL